MMKQDETMISRRVAVGSSALAVLGLLSRSAFGQAEGKTSGGGSTESRGSASGRSQQQADEMMALFERMGSANSPQERAKLMAEMTAANRNRAIEGLKDPLGVSDKEWAVIKPRLEAVYDLVHPTARAQAGSAGPATDLEEKAKNLHELLRDEKAPTDQIKAKLTAYRAARDRSAQQLTQARQNLRQVVTLRQEALLVLRAYPDNPAQRYVMTAQTR